MSRESRVELSAPRGADGRKLCPMPPECPTCTAILESDVLLDVDWLWCWNCLVYWRLFDGLLFGPIDRLVPFLT